MFASTTNAVRCRYSGLLEVIHAIAKEEGILALWKGTTVSLMLVSNPAIQVLLIVFGPFAVIALTHFSRQFMCYDAFKRWLLLTKRGALSSLDFFLLGCLAKMAATFATYPLQLAQSRLRSKRYAHLSTVACMLAIIEAHGALALFEGMPAKMIQTCLAAAYSFLTYEKMLQVCVLLLEK